MLAAVTADLERAEIAAFRDVYLAVPVALARGQGFAVVEAGGAVCGVARALSGVRELNRVMGLGVSRPATEADLEEIESVYADTAFVVALAPAARPAELGELLAARGYAEDYAWMKFSREPAGDLAAASKLRLERVGPDRADDFGLVAVAGYGMPPFMAAVIRELPGREGWSCWVAYDGERPVATGALRIAGDSAWLGFAATLPDARGRGAQSALLAARVREAAEAGCTTVTTETGVQEPGRPRTSYGNILRAGFAEAYVRPNWASPR